MVQRIEDHRYKDKIVDYIRAVYRSKTDDKVTQTEDMR